MNDHKSKHKLTSANCKKLAILSRILEICLLNYVIKFFIIFGIAVAFKIFVECNRLVLQWSIIVIIPIYIIYVFTAVTFFLLFTFCFIIISCYLIKLTIILS